MIATSWCSALPIAFGGDRLATGSRGDPENTRATERVFQDERKARNVSSCRRTGPIDGQQRKLRFALKVIHLRHGRLRILRSKLTVTKPLFLCELEVFIDPVRANEWCGLPSCVPAASYNNSAVQKAVKSAEARHSGAVAADMSAISNVPVPRSLADFC
jgi:hypothetical protein